MACAMTMFFDRSSGMRSACELLVASPRLDDSNFERSVVLVLDRGPEGALGVILNRPTGVAVDQRARALDATRWHWLPPACSSTVVRSPVTRSSASVGATARPRRQDGVPSSTMSAPSTWRWTLPTCRWRCNGARLFSGYSGWSPGQLDEEIAEGAWFVVEATADDAFVSDPDTQWHDVLRRQSGSLAMLATYPPSPLVN